MKSTTLVWLLWLMVCGASTTQAENRTQNEFLVPIKLYDKHLVVVRGALGVLQGRNLVVDTGAYPSVIDRDIARKLKLEVHREELHVLAQNVPAGSSVVPQVEVGPLQVHNLRVMVEDLSELSADFGVHVDALIGLDVLSHMSFAIDYAAQEIAFGAPLQLTFSAPLERRASMAGIRMTVNGHGVYLLVDTGAAKTVLFAQRLPWLEVRRGRDQDFRNLGHRRCHRLRSFHYQN